MKGTHLESSTCSFLKLLGSFKTTSFRKLKKLFECLHWLHSRISSERQMKFNQNDEDIRVNLLIMWDECLSLFIEMEMAAMNGSDLGVVFDKVSNLYWSYRRYGS